MSNQPTSRSGPQLAHELECLEQHATHGQWTVYDSNSWRRIGLRGEYQTIIEPTVHRDGCPDLTGKNRDNDLTLLMWLRNHVPEIIAALRAAASENRAHEQALIEAAVDAFKGQYQVDVQFNLVNMTRRYIALTKEENADAR